MAFFLQQVSQQFDFVNIVHLFHLMGTSFKIVEFLRALLATTLLRLQRHLNSRLDPDLIESNTSGLHYFLICSFSLLRKFFMSSSATEEDIRRLVSTHEFSRTIVGRET
jgi:hypothetical protein